MKIDIDGAKISREDILANIRQKPNIKILGLFKFQLALYNLSGKNQERWYNRWFRTIGEEPVIYEDFLTLRSVDQIKLYLKNNGYYNAEVKDTVFYKKNKKAKVLYKIKTGTPYIVNNMGYLFNDTIHHLKGYNDIRNLILNDSVNSIVVEKERMNVDNIGKEISRTVKMIRNRGYYNFSEKYLHYYADSTLGNRKIDLFLDIRENKMQDKKDFLRYKFRNIYINMNYDPHIMVDSVLRSKVNHDTLCIGRNHLIFEDKPYLNHKVLMDALRFGYGDYYNIDKVDQTYLRFQSLRQFKFINIKFIESDSIAGDSTGFLDCYIHLKPLNPQKYSVMVEGTNSGGNIGMAGNLSYQHRNVFNRAEILTVTLSGSLEKERIKESELFNTKEYGIKAKLVSPQFLLPFLKLTEFRKKYYPQTALSLSFDNQETFYFSRKIVGASYGYMWKYGRNWRYNLNLIDLDFVSMKNVNEDFIADLQNAYIKNAYTDHMIMASNFSIIYSSNGSRSFINKNYWRFNIESAGNFANAFNNILGERTIERDDSGQLVDDYYSYWGIRYAQYIKADIEYRHNHRINIGNSFVSRFFLGIAYPYGNMKVLPYEKMYYCGGANGIRAWQVRTLGPGSFVKSDGNNFPNQVSDLKIEANFEYRFKLIGRTEGALFMDVGNIWSLTDENRGEEEKFELSRFYKELAVGTGFGVRFDFKFFILRLDAGIKVVDPARPEGKRFIFMKKGYNKIGDMTLNIGIGYPF